MLHSAFRLFLFRIEKCNFSTTWLKIVAQWLKKIHLQCRRCRFDPLIRNIALEKEIATHSSILNCLENPMYRGSCQATVHGVTESPTWLSNWAWIQTKAWDVSAVCKHPWLYKKVNKQMMNYRVVLGNWK